MQTNVPDAARGRVMATLQASMSGASVASMALAGAFGDVLGIREVFFVWPARSSSAAASLACWSCYRGRWPRTR